MRFYLPLILALGLIAAGTVEWASAAWNEPGPPASSGKQSVVLIAPRTSVHDIARQLQDAHLLNYALVFELDLRLHRLNDQVKAGEYAVPSKASMADIAAILVSGKSIQHRLTAAEGLTSAMIAKLVVDEPALTGDAGAVPAEGSLLPETYLFTRGVTRAEMLDRMRKAQQTFLAEHWLGRAQDLPFRSMDQAVILASIVEKETSLPEERRHIAAIFINRLKAGMKLQSDPTIIYGISKGYPLGRGIRESEIQADTPYNTYVIDGLPPTAISNPGKDSLAAVLNPEDSRDLYFVATGRGGHAFAATMAEHQKNVIAYRALEKLKDSGEVASPSMAPPKPDRHRHA
ncbi:MAG TPA: endolytic transglycosylase MltG [Rhizomicrobium sp.]|nr:endolytic transglycosylase MltG [Rhizomicrobium sp.]